MDISLFHFQKVLLPKNFKTSKTNGLRNFKLYYLGDITYDWSFCSLLVPKIKVLSKSFSVLGSKTCDNNGFRLLELIFYFLGGGGYQKTFHKLLCAFFLKVKR